MARIASAYRQAVTAHREARERLGRLTRALAECPVPANGETADLVARLARVGAALATPTPGATPLTVGPVPVRVGEASTVDGDFPVVVPLGSGRHLAVDTDARDPRVAALLRALVLRLVATAPPGTVRVAALDPATFGAAFLPLRPLVDAGVLDPPATTEPEIASLLDTIERHARLAQQAGPDADLPTLVVVGAAPPPPRELARLAALTHAGPTAALCVLLAGQPPRDAGPPPPPLAAATRITLTDRYAHVGDPPGLPYSPDGTGLAAPVLLDGDPAPATVAALAEHLAAATRQGAALRFTDLLPANHWAESARAGLRTVIGRAGRTPVTVAFDDATPHWLVGGRTGAGKTVFLLDVLYGLATRYSPAELHLYLLDFKEGVSFTEFVPTGRDPSWLPHARAVGIESDREYGVAVLRELRRELGRRAGALKRYGVTKLADLPRDTPAPRVVAVVDEFHVLLAGNDSLAREAVTLLEELARKGRSYGVHLVLASQSTAGIEALYGKADAIFGQFPLRVALPGGSGVLDPLNPAADALTIGTAVLNTAAGAAGPDTVIRFPDAHADAADLARLRHQLWQARPAGNHSPAVFRGYEAAHVEDDPVFAGLRPGVRRPAALVGRAVDVTGSTAAVPLDATPGRHLAVVGTSAAGAHVLRAAAWSLARQHAPGTARFLLAPLVAAADPVADDLGTALTDAGHPVDQLDATGLRGHVGQLATAPAAPPTGRTYLVVFGVDAAGAVLGLSDPATFRTGYDDLRAVLRHAPGYGVHLLGWWRGLRRLADDLGGTQNRDDVACLVALNVPGAELGLHLGVTDLAYTPRANRALLVDRHEHRTQLIVPFVGAGHEPDEEGLR
ncbi:cell division protein FtsK [Micromonospora echinospora]|uniref:FtsK/SpoIIIE family protein n=1 Tax=Micromonospora echinospora TaxID=1877 RepID=A0A1C4YGC7_MICEC|nr:FtsK/SpoIIIE domain-containing protein [Micromonospora echinospora]OZV84746.1 cell division protein FtsK [Micromonospora echinospora]SCF19782.1 FtsK/SpoIIIE family protein [Micromonospora echinospora]